MREDDYQPYKMPRRPRAGKIKLWYRRNVDKLYELATIAHIVGAILSVGYLFLTIPDKLMFVAFALVITLAARWR